MFYSGADSVPSPVSYLNHPEDTTADREGATRLVDRVSSRQRLI